MEPRRRKADQPLSKISRIAALWVPILTIIGGGVAAWTSLSSSVAATSAELRAHIEQRLERDREMNNRLRRIEDGQEQIKQLLMNSMERRR